MRFVITWESIEHEEAGIYDEAYLAYLRKIFLAAEKESVSVFIEPDIETKGKWTAAIPEDAENSSPDWLRNHYTAAFKHAHRRLKNCKAITGWGELP